NPIRIDVVTFDINALATDLVYTCTVHTDLPFLSNSACLVSSILRGTS
ncbi:MAG: hypothetical protein ACI9OF_001747, partial [Saprospiraceae bacterium]